MVCSVCRLESRPELDADLLACRGSLRDIARRYGTTKDALARHRVACIPQFLTHAKAEKQTEQAETLLDRLAALEVDAQRIQAAAEAAGDHRAAIGAVRERSRLLEFRGKLDGKIQAEPRTVVNVLQLTPAEREHRRRLLLRVLTQPAEEPETGLEVVRPGP
jgi:hypothetical protein